MIEESNLLRVPELVPVRHGRMAASPFAFLLGSSVVMTSDLATTPYTSIEVQCSGDAHLENFGAVATPERQPVFDLIDFDESAPGPWEWDLKRLVVSVVVAGRTAGVPEGEARAAALTTAEAYRLVTRELAVLPHLDSWYSAVRAEELVGTLDEVPLRRPPPPVAADVEDPELIDRVHGAFCSVRESLHPEVRDLIDRYEVVDVVPTRSGLGGVGTRGT